MTAVAPVVRRSGTTAEEASGEARKATVAAACATGASVLVDGGMLQMGPTAGSQLGADDWRRP
jgi:hypothetical protein